MRRQLCTLDRVGLFALCLDADEWRPHRRVAAVGTEDRRYMLSDQLGPNIKNLVGNADPTRADYGFGLGVAVRTQPGVARMMGSVGQFSWPGASGTDRRADPKEEPVVVYLSAAPARSAGTTGRRSTRSCIRPSSSSAPRWRDVRQSRAARSKLNVCSEFSASSLGTFLLACCFNSH
jgi:CubicO group peptidase (beta-lactamase class C family)